jgi:F-type H+-transporting ATPase subunit delta
MESVSERYAQALFALALEQEKIEIYQKEAKNIYQSLEDNPQMVKLLSSAFLSQEEKDLAVDSAYKSITLEDLKNFIKVVSKNGRAYLLERILRDFNKLCNEQRGISSGIVYSTYSLSETEINEVERAFEKNEGLKTELTNEIDSSLIGGIKVVIGGRVYDGSLANSLEKLKVSIMQGGSNQHGNKD